VVSRDDARLTRLEQLIGAVDRSQQRHAFLALPFGVMKKFGEDRAGSLAALIAYYGFFSLFPLLLVLVTVLGFVLAGSPSLQERILESALAQFPVIGSQIRENTGRLDRNGVALAVGLVSALWAGMGVMRAAETAMSDVWDVPINKRPGFLPQVLRALGMIVVLGAGVAATALLTGAVGAVPGRAVAYGGFVLGAALNVGIALLGFRVLTARDVGLRALLPGAVLAGVAALLLQLLGGYLLDRQVRNAGDVYGTFAVVLGLLWWLYLQAQVVLVAAELNAVTAKRLWPRSLRPPRTAADERAVRAHARVEERVDEQDPEVTSTRRGEDRRRDRPVRAAR
jgi:YihY family inner membrane protein